MSAIRPLTFAFASLLVILLAGNEVAEAGKAAGKGNAKGAGKGGNGTKLDSNGDGKISRDEFNASGKGKGGGKVFDRLDSNGDGFLTKDELSKGGGAKKKAK